MRKNICPHCFKKFPDYNSLWYHTATLHSNKYNNSGLITNFNNNNLNQVLLSENKVQLLGVNKIENVKIIENEQNIKKEDKLEHEQNIKKQDKLEHIQIIAEINNLNDLICLAEKVGKEYKLDSNIIYNIDLKTLNKMLPELYDLNNMIGQPNIKNQVTNIILYHSLNLHQNDPDLLHTVIDGPPGTGKTEFAQKIAKIYLKMGLLTKDVFKKVRRSDLIAGFLGQTALKTSDVLKEVRGGVLFIDEAYSLGNYQGKSSQDSYSKECVDLINQSLTL